MRHLVLSLLVAASAVSASACSVQNAIAGGLIAAQSLFVGEAQEIQLGQETEIQVLKEYPEYPNPVIKDYLTTIGNRLVGQSERKNLKYTWHVVDSKEANAFAAPGGFVFVTTAALRLMKNEAELAGVVGHEVVHVAKQHSLNAIRTTMIAQGIVTGVLGQTPGELAKAGAGIAANLILKHGDRNQELEADKIGSEYAYALGYDPRALGTFLNTLSTSGPEASGWMTWFSDHPGTNDRLTLLNEHFVAKGWTFTGKELGEESYKTNVLANLGAAPVVTPAAN